MENILLSDIEARVFGSLIEKSVLTADYYPLTLNLLQSACNQRSSRNPVMELEAKEVLRALDSLRQKKLALEIGQEGARVPKYKYTLAGCEALADLPEAELALLCCLLLRGAQTGGELKSRCERLYAFESVEQVGELLENMAGREDMPLIVKLPRQSGKRENRFMHLLCGMPELGGDEEDYVPLSAARLELEEEERRFAGLEGQVKSLQEQVEQLQSELHELKKMVS
ncbi:MAG: DUF480 domain-containing protein [Lentisphaeria bacterium]|jgi:uncharacterized protein YceH (UPF0502 family)|nr:DUF480 domain-containing protein [Lentisphaeria bacterium]MDY0176349.1 DUF480 domain-containing protein [Lentisphaeria bacterium]NLZ59334.1 DUF480 domain-containing protein [Lentisphaerota bacterium]